MRKEIQTRQCDPEIIEPQEEFHLSEDAVILDKSPLEDDDESDAKITVRHGKNGRTTGNAPNIPKQRRNKRAIINCSEFPLHTIETKLDNDAGHEWADPIESAVDNKEKIDNDDSFVEDLTNLLTPKVEPAKPPPSLRIRKQRSKVVIQQKDQGPQILTVPQNVIKIEGLNSMKGTPNIQINYHTYITNYPGCSPYQYQSKPIVVLDDFEKVVPEPMTARNANTAHKMKSTFVNKLHGKLLSPQETPHHKLSVNEQKSALLDGGKRRVKVKLGGDKSVRQITILKESTAEMPPEVRAKLIRSIKKSFMGKDKADTDAR